MDVVALDCLHGGISHKFLALTLRVLIVLMKHGEVDVFCAGLLLQIFIYVSRLTDLSKIWGLPLGSLLNPPYVLCLNDNSNK